MNDKFGEYGFGMLGYICFDINSHFRMQSIEISKEEGRLYAMKLSKTEINMTIAKKSVHSTLPKT